MDRSSKPKKILVVHGSRAMRAILQDLLQNKGSWKLDFIEFEEFDSNVVEDLEPDLVLAGFTRLRNEDADELIKFSSRLKHQPIKVFVVSMEVSDALEQELVRQGICGIISSESDFRFLPKAIESVFRGELWCSRFVLQQILEKYRNDIGSGAVNSKESILTDREKEVVQLIVLGFKNREIADKLCISYSTVINHVYRIYRKLNVENRAEAISYILSSNIIAD